MEPEKYKVLLLEDDKIVQMAFERLVRKKQLPYDYVIAGSIREARAALAEHQFDVVISDYRLGDGTGFDILDSTKQTPVIFATGAGSEELAVKAMKAGAYDYLIKDPSHNYLAVLPLTVEKAVKHARMEQEVRQYHENLEHLVKERTEQLEAEKELLSVTLSSMTDGVIVVNLQKHIMLINKVAERLTGTSSEQVRGKVVDEIFRLVDERSREPVANPIDKVLSTGEVETLNSRGIVLLGNDREHPVSVAAAPIRTAQENIRGVVVLLHDLSGQQEIDRMKTDFVSCVSHELRTPLTSIKAYTATILRDPNMPEQTKRQFLVTIDKEADRLTNLVNELLEISQLESGESKATYQDEVDVAGVINEVVSSLRQSAAEKNIQMELDVAEALPKIAGDERKIRSMISNVVNNAIKFTPPSGRIRICARIQADGLAICISDTGIGIPEPEIPKIFERFYRVRQPGKQIQGTGLGLAIVNEIAAMYGAKVEVESKLGEGSTFRIILPVPEEAALEAAGKQR